MLATSREAAGELVSAFRKRQVHKYYVALSDRKPSKKMGSVVGDMEKGRRGAWLLARTHADPAVTRFTSVGVPGGRPGLRAFLLKPETGRTHQLRVALKSLGAPVLGDEVRHHRGGPLLLQPAGDARWGPGPGAPAAVCHLPACTECPPTRLHPRSATRSGKRRLGRTGDTCTAPRCGSSCRVSRCRWCARRRMVPSSAPPASERCLTPGCRRSWRHRRGLGLPTASCCGRSCRRLCEPPVGCP